MKAEQFQQVVARIGEILTQTPPDMDALAQAEAAVERLLNEERDNEGLTFLMGTVYMKQGRWAMAEHWMRRSIEQNAKRAEPWNNLGYIYQQEARTDESRAAFDTALDWCNEDNRSEILGNKASLLVNNGTPLEALEACDAALALDDENVDARWNKALALLEMGDWQQGWDLYETGLKMSPNSTAQRKRRDYVSGIKYWEGTADKSVVVYGEQGVGDEIMGASMLPDMIERCDVMLEAHPRLVTLFRKAFGEKIPIYGTRKASVEDLAWQDWARPQAKAPILHLGGHFRNHVEEFPREPYLVPLDEQREDARRWLATLGERPRIGIAWQGGTMPTRADLRSVPLPMWEQMLRTVDATWVSLQYDPAEAPGMWQPIVHRFNEDKTTRIHHSTLWANDLDMCYGGLIHELDLVISVNTSLVHACGAMGVECWALTPSRPAWRYGVEGEHMPWYGDHVRLLRQQGDNWAPVMHDLTNRLCDRVATLEAAA